MCVYPIQIVYKLNKCICIMNKEEALFFVSKVSRVGISAQNSNHPNSSHNKLTRLYVHQMTNVKYWLDVVDFAIDDYVWQCMYNPFRLQRSNFNLQYDLATRAFHFIFVDKHNTTGPSNNDHTFRLPISLQRKYSPTIVAPSGGFCN